LTVQEGALHGLSLRWEQLDPDGLQLTIPDWLEETEAGIVKTDETADRTPGGYSFRTIDGRTFVIGRTRSAEDLDSLRNLHELFSTRLTGISNLPAPPASITCGECGATVPPQTEGMSRCLHCGAAVTVPAQIAAHLAAWKKLALPEHFKDLLNEISALPDARRVNRLTRLLQVGLTIIAAIAIVLFALFMTTAAANMAAAGLLVASVIVIFAGARQIGARHVVDRMIFELIGRRFGARPPLSPDGRWTCPLCGGSLPDGPSPLRRCDFCRSYSVVGIDARLSGFSAGQEEMEEALEAQFLKRRQTMRWMRIAVVGMIAALVGIGVAGGVAVSRYDVERSCRRGNGQACYEISWQLDNRSTPLWQVRSDRRAIQYAQRSCEAGNGCGCDRLYEMAGSELTRRRIFGSDGETENARIRELQQLMSTATTHPVKASGSCHDDESL